MKNMRGTRVAFFLPSLGKGGAEKVASVIVSTLCKHYDIYFVLQNGEQVYATPDKIPVITLRKFSSLKILNLIFSCFQYRSLCNYHKFDISVSLLTQPNLIAMVSRWIGNRTKIILCEHTYQSLWRSNELVYAWLKKNIIRIIYNRADRVITVSKKIGDDLAINFDVKKNLIVPIYNPYQIDKIIKQSLIPLEYRRGSRRTIVTVGTLYSVKNQQLLIRAFANLKQWNQLQLLILGEGSDHQKLSELIIGLGVEENVELLGFQENPFNYLNASDVFVLSSNSEGLPNVIIEALACGCCVVSTDCLSGPREILAPNTELNRQLVDSIEYAEYGVLVPVGDVSLMNAALDQVLTDNDLFASYKSKSLERARMFDEEFMVGKYKQLFDEVLVT